MPEHIRALVFILVLSVGVFAVARGAVVQLVPVLTYKRWCRVWLLLTCVLFLSHSVWLCFLLMAALLLAQRRKEAHVMGLYFVALFVAPPTAANIPGLGIIDHLWAMDHYRLLALVLLLPAALSLAQRGSTLRLFASPVDWMVLSYVGLLSLLSFRDVSVTAGMRAVLSLWVDFFLPYYVASRSVKDMDGFRHVLTAFVMACLVLAFVAAFEALRSWRLYQAVLYALGFEGFGTHYLMRSGFLRPNATAGHSIVLGYILTVGLGFFLYLKSLLHKPLHRWLGWAALLLGILASLSRGPWVGSAFLLMVFVLLGPRPLVRLAQLALLATMTLLVLSQLPYGQLFIDMLPGIGTVEQHNVEYRADLLTNALPVIQRHLLFGSANFLEAPELQVMIQGEGIIDIVNSYVGVALQSGLVGLSFFVGAFLMALHQARKGLGMARRTDPAAAVLGRSLLATLAAIMLIIYTVSGIFGVPTVYWAVIGLCVAYASAMQAALTQKRRQAAP